MRVPTQPDLYLADTDPPTLVGTRCAACGRTAFPTIEIGCDVCGASEEQLEKVELPTSGLLHSIATVHLHQGKSGAPFSIAEIKLDTGPLIRAMVAQGVSQLRVGDRVVGTWQLLHLDDDGNEVVEPAFMGATE
jgi:uncharacterized OB-fold protein